MCPKGSTNGKSEILKGRTVVAATCPAYESTARRPVVPRLSPKRKAHRRACCGRFRPVPRKCSAKPSIYYYFLSTIGGDCANN
ncbi:unnamed protein product, partial [Amoebophrya sp. A25]|eukprot:GSA25T00025959001.1